jgi:hypothetical protein
VKKFEEHFMRKYPKYKWGEVEDGDVRKYIEQLNQLVTIDSVKEVYHNNKAAFMTEAIYLMKDDEITMTMAAEMKPYQLAILRLNQNIDNQTRLYAELNWK